MEDEEPTVSKKDYRLYEDPVPLSGSWIESLHFGDISVHGLRRERGEIFLCLLC
jgi:hypothetical protein